MAQGGACVALPLPYVVWACCEEGLRAYAGTVRGALTVLVRVVVVSHVDLHAEGAVGPVPVACAPHTRANGHEHVASPEHKL